MVEGVLLEKAHELVFKVTDILGGGPFLSPWGTAPAKEHLQNSSLLRVFVSVLNKWQQTLSGGSEG